MSELASLKVSPPFQTVVMPDKEEPAAALSPADDSELVHKAKHGDMDAYGELVRRYQERIYATIYHMTSNHEDANDLAQETFIKSSRRLNHSKETPAFTRGFIASPSTKPSIS